MSPIEALPVLHDWPLTAGIMQVNGQSSSSDVYLLFIYIIYIYYISFIW